MTDDQSVPVRFTVNGREQELQVGAGETLLRTLRDRLYLTGAKEGCLEGECGACTVLVDGAPVDSCILATAAMEGREVRTVEGLSQVDQISPLQQAFLDHAAVQCGFCIPGILMTLTALLERQPSPTREGIETALAGNICRCTGYRQIVEAAMAVAAEETS